MSDSNEKKVDDTQKIDVEKKIVEQVSTKLPEPGDRRLQKETVQLDVTPTLAFNKDTVLYILYLQYKANMITRQHLKTYFAIINGKHPEDIAKWLVGESARG
jgi:hypothetical protein